MNSLKTLFIVNHNHKYLNADVNCVNTKHETHFHAVLNKIKSIKNHFGTSGAIQRRSSNMQSINDGSTIGESLNNELKVDKNIKLSVVMRCDYGDKMRNVYCEKSGLDKSLKVSESKVRKDDVKDVVRDLYTKGLMIANPHPDNFEILESGKIIPKACDYLFEMKRSEQLPLSVKVHLQSSFQEKGYHYVPADLQASYVSVLDSL